jgi:hypothetical protein
MARTFGVIAILCAALGLATVPGARAAEPSAPAPLPASEDPLSTDWLSAPLLPMPSGGSTCRADDSAGRSTASTAAKLARLRAMLAAEAAQGPQQPGQVVVLGNRGYNYGGNAVVDPSLLDFEARHSQD